MEIVRYDGKLRIPLTKSAPMRTVNGQRTVIYDAFELPDNPEPADRIVQNYYRNHPEIMHYRVAENMTACVEGGDRELYQVWGQISTLDRSLVGCPACLEWLHA